MKRIKKFVKMIVIVGAVVGLAYLGLDTYQKKATISTYTAEITETVKEQVKESDIEKRMEEVKKRSDFQEKVQAFEITEARRIATAEYEKDEEAKYLAIQAEIEKSKEEVRKSELNFE